MTESPESRDDSTGTRRGRKPIRPDPESGPVALFAHRLWELKERAGDPSFADMASRLGAAASKSSLAAAARGSALPSWETTWEFVRVLAVDRLGGDPEEVRREWRTHWEQAANLGYRDDLLAGQDGSAAPDHPVHGPPPSTGAPAREHTPLASEHRPPFTDREPSSGEPQSPPAGHLPPSADDRAPGSDHESSPADGPRPGPASPGRPASGKRLTVLAAVTGVVGVAAILIGWVLPLITGDARTGPGTATSPSPSTPQSLTPFDDSKFEKDVTYPDGTVVQAGESFDKTWRIRNAGNVPWHGRYLTRMNDTPCKAPKRVGIGPVAPGESVDITVRVRAADSSGRCKIYWKMTDEDGTPLLAGKRPIFLDVTVA